MWFPFVVKRICGSSQLLLAPVRWRERKGEGTAESSYDSGQGYFFRLCVDFSNLGPSRATAAAEKGAKREIYDFFGLLAAEMRGKDRVYFVGEVNK